MSNWHPVGKVRSARGLKGELFVIIFSKQWTWINQLKQIQIGDLREAYTVRSARSYKEGILLGLEGVNDRTEAEKLKGKKLLIPQELLVSAPGERIFLHEILGFQMKTQQGELIGPVVEFSSNGAQDLLVIEKEGKHFEIPFVPALIQDIHFDLREIIVQLPEGLLE